MSSRRRYGNGGGFGGFENEFEDLTRLWGLRLLAHMNPQILFQRIQPDTFSLLLDIPYINVPKPEEVGQFAKTAILPLVEQTRERPRPLYDNIELLAGMLGFNQVEQEIVAFIATAERYEPLMDLIRGIGDLSDEGLARILAIALDLEIQDVRCALRENSSLQGSELLRIEGQISSIDSKLHVLPGLANALFSRHDDLESLLSFCLKRSAPASLSIDDFNSHRNLVSQMTSYLKLVRSEGGKGCNILLYGPPGVGKTEMVRTVVNSAGFTLYEIGLSSPNLSERSERFVSYRFCQGLLAGDSRAVILFDEVEDVFPSSTDLLSPFGRKSSSGSHKAWTNRALETNPVPAFWVANEVDQIDPAFLRRFDMVAEIGPLSRSTRRRILHNTLAGKELPDGFLDRLAENPNLTPADATRLKRVIPSIDMSNFSAFEEQAGRVLLGHLKARGVSSIAPHYPRPQEYRLDLLNADIDVAALTETLQRRPSGRICIFGPPGTGKTALGHHLAEVLDRPILVKRASDLLSMWVGETEKAIARMFQEARDENSLLFLDEADSFLQSRQGAHRSWEITQVNELLTQMECFDGLFICATNFMDSLDPAVLRRFTFKIRFDYLTGEQKEKCFLRTMEAAGHPLFGGMPPEIRPGLSRLRNLTPGDFAPAVERYRILGVGLSAELLLQELEKESRLKPAGPERLVGFMPCRIDLGMLT